jgi:hypothetical protein
MSVCTPSSLSACLYVHHAVCQPVCMYSMQYVSLSGTPCSLSACLYVRTPCVSRPVCMFTMQSVCLSVCTHLAVCLPVLPFLLTIYFLMPCSPVSLSDKIQFVSVLYSWVIRNAGLLACQPITFLPTFSLPLSADRQGCLSVRSPTTPLSDFLPLCIGLPAFRSVPLLSWPVRLSVDLFAFPPETCMTTFLRAGRPANLKKLPVYRMVDLLVNRQKCLPVRVRLSCLFNLLVDLSSYSGHACLPVYKTIPLCLACQGTSFEVIYCLSTIRPALH